MLKSNILLIAKHYLKKTFSNKGLFALLLVYVLVLVYVAINSWNSYSNYTHEVTHHQEMSRESWENNPDKHPHRMAHFGNFVFRQAHPLSVFDSGIESYTGNSIFLEAHRQNTANFSEASLSTGLLRFGKLDIAMLLQLILPLIIFFIGYSCITSEKENGILKIIITQGATLKDVLLGKSLGLFIVSALFFVPGFIAMWSLLFAKTSIVNANVISRTLLITLCYLCFYVLLCFITVIVSAKSAHSNHALLRLLASWLILFIIVPKTAQVVGKSFYPNQSKIEFKSEIEAIISKTGDSHNPNDPFFESLKDSVLKANNVSSIKDLPFNYSGYLMQRGEKQSATVYSNQHKKLINTYKKQNSITNNLVWLNPFLALKNLSMSFAATDFDTYVNFLSQTEDYRYKQAQYMNELQMKFISNKAKSSEGKVHVVDKKYWKNTPRFKYQFIEVSETLSNQWSSMTALFVWFIVALIVILKFSNKFKVI